MGALIILDNGIYERVAVEDAYLYERIKQFKPDVAVLPDVPGSESESLRRSKEFADFLDKQGYKGATMCVVHKCSSDIYRAAIKIASYIALPRCLVNGAAMGSRARIHFIAQLKREHVWNSSVSHHALGMLGGNTEELWGLTHQAVTSCDSSAPIWRGLHGYGLLDPWPDYPFDPFDTKADDWPRAVKNLQEVHDACKLISAQ